MTAKPTQIEGASDPLASGVQTQNAMLIILIFLAGVLLALNLIPYWLPGMAASAAGSEPKIFWYLSRGSAIAAFWVLWLSMAMGVIITNKLAQVWPGIPPAYEIHQYASLLGLGLALFHALILTGDRYIQYTVIQVLVPFSGQSYRPVWVGLGQLGFYLWAVVTLSFYVRKRMSKQAWRAIHFGSYASFLGVVLHGIFAGTDSAAGWGYYMYWISCATLLFLTIYRVLITRMPATPASHPKA